MSTTTEGGAPATARRDRAALESGAAAWAIVGFGVAVRLRGYLAGRSLRRDEAHLALNLLERSYAGLLRPLDNAQGAPVGFLWIQKAILDAFGSSEYALRALPVLAASAALPLFLVVARRLVGARAALVGLALLAASEPSIDYAAQVKQYASDTAVALLIFAAATSRRGEVGVLGRPIAMALIGALATWISHPSLFVLGGVGLAATIAVFAPDSEDRPRAALVTAAVFACWAASFLANHLLFLRGLARNDDLIRFWAGAFAPFPPRSPADVKWYLEHVPALFEYPVGLKFGGIGIALTILGGLAFWRGNRPALAMLATPAALVLVASALRMYPFSGRLLLFAVPLVALMVSAGSGFVDPTGEGDRRAIASVLVGVLLLHPTINALNDLARPLQAEELAPVLREVDRRLEEGDAIYVYFASKPAYIYYTRFADPPILPEPAPTFGSDTLRDQPALDDDADRLAGHPRAWIIFSHVIQGDEAYLVEHLDRIGQRLDEIQGFGASAYLYHLGFGPGPRLGLGLGGVRSRWSLPNAERGKPEG